MEKNKAAFALALLLLLPSFGVGQQTRESSPQLQRVQAFTQGKALPDEVEPSHFEFSTLSYSYRILRNGGGRRTGGPSPARPFNLRLSRHLPYLDSFIYHAQYLDDILLICGVTNYDYGVGFIARLNGRTLRIKWKRDIPSFNVGQGLIEGKHAYVTAIGFTGKIDLDSGGYVWEHDDLYSQGDGALILSSYRRSEEMSSLSERAKIVSGGEWQIYRLRNKTEE